jgi:nucleotide-binding universal stress UspA family protein
MSRFFITGRLRQALPLQPSCAEAHAQSADLIAMTTAGRHGFLDALRGSTTEQVLEHAPCPVLAVHAWVD